MLTALTLELTLRVWRATLIAFLDKTPRERLFAVVVIVALIIDLAIPVVTFGCLGFGGCSLPRM